MNAEYEVAVVEEKITQTEKQEVELGLSELDLIGGGSVGQIFV